MKELTELQVIAWNGGDETGLAKYLVWALNNPELAKKEILIYESED